jgi:agmatine deiminase
MIADYETNVVYFSSWLEKEYPKIYIDLVTVLKKNNVAYDHVLMIYGVEIICLFR